MRGEVDLRACRVEVAGLLNVVGVDGVGKEEELRIVVDARCVIQTAVAIEQPDEQLRRRALRAETRRCAGSHAPARLTGGVARRSELMPPPEVHEAVDVLLAVI